MKKTMNNTGGVAEALFGLTRRKVLALLFGRPDEDFYLRQLARETGSSAGTLQREMGKLVAAGLVTRRPRGKQVFYQANRESPVFAEIRGLMEKTAGLADVVRASLVDFADAGRIALAFIYGSIAAGTHGSSSDVDLMLVGDLRLTELIPTLRAAQVRVGREINPTIYSAAEFQDRLRVGEHFLSQTVARPRIMLIGTENELAKLAGE